MYKLVKVHLIYFGVYYLPITAGAGPANYRTVNSWRGARPGVGSAGCEEATSEDQNRSSGSCPYLRLRALKTRRRKVLAFCGPLGPTNQLPSDSVLSGLQLPLGWWSLETGKAHCEPLSRALGGSMSASPAASRETLPP